MSWLNKRYPNNSKRGTLKGFVGTALVLDVKKLNFTPGEFSTRI